MKKCIPRSNTDINNLRAILKNINNGFKTTWNDYNIGKPKYVDLISALMKAGVVLEIEKKDKSTDEYTIADIYKYSEWAKSDFYKPIRKYVLPLLPALLDLIPNMI